MAGKPVFSVFLYLRDRQDSAEQWLTSLLEIANIPFELFITDDASSDETAKVIESILQHYNSEHVFYLRHEQPAGRGNSLNELLHLSNTPLIWVPDVPGKINEYAFENCLQRLHHQKPPYVCQPDKPLPEDAEGWLDSIDSGELPGDHNFIWNLKSIPFRQQVFNPFIEVGHGAELALRLRNATGVLSDSPFYIPLKTNSLSIPSYADKNELYFSLLRSGPISQKVYAQALNQLRATPQAERKMEEADNAPGSERDQTADVQSLLAEARQLQIQGHIYGALQLVEQVLEQDPKHREAQDLKVKLLEKQRRFVEAAELKHEINKPRQPNLFSSSPVKTSIIIPTTGHGKALLEQCLVSIEEHTDPDTCELIIVDNASLDDTHDYLEELKRQQFFNCRIITNSRNKGFAASINLGLKAANGEYACILHNDVTFNGPVIRRLENLMQQHPDFALIGPVTNRTLNPDQSIRNIAEDPPQLQEAEYLDSFCMMLRTDCQLEMDPRYGLAFFEDIDLCFSARRQGFKVGIAPGIEVHHAYGSTTLLMGLDTDTPRYWQNVAVFNQKWEINLTLPGGLEDKEPLQQMLKLNEMVNPIEPEEQFVRHFRSIFTDEVRTQILNSDFEENTLLQLTELMLAMNQRDVLRRLEDKLEGVTLPASLVHRFIAYYFERNIYSRCLHYLDMLEYNKRSIQSEIYHLEILIENKEMGEAIPKLRSLLDEASAHPHLYKLAGDIHVLNGNHKEADEFYRLSAQIDPFDHAEKESA